MIRQTKEVNPRLLPGEAPRRVQRRNEAFWGRIRRRGVTGKGKRGRTDRSLRLRSAQLATRLGCRRPKTVGEERMKQDERPTKQKRRRGDGGVEEGSLYSYGKRGLLTITPQQIVDKTLPAHR
jgi:hypothetical protein